MLTSIDSLNVCGYKFTHKSTYIDTYACVCTYVYCTKIKKTLSTSAGIGWVMLSLDGDTSEHTSNITHICVNHNPVICMFMPSYTYINTYIHKYIHTYIYIILTYIHTYFILTPLQPYTVSDLTCSKIIIYNKN